MSLIKKKKLESVDRKPPLQRSAFLERPLPDAEEVLRFEQAVKKEVLVEEMDHNLSAIYRDGRGNMVDVGRVKKHKRIGLIVLFKRLFVLTVLACGLYGAFYYFQKPAGTDGVLITIKAPEKIAAGAPLVYELEYRNDSGLSLSNVNLEAVLPESFILTESNPSADGINSWSIGNLAAGQNGRILISGYLVAVLDSANIITAKLNYVPANFSSEFKKEMSANTVIAELGFNVSADYLNTALIGQNNELTLELGAFKDNKLKDIYLEISGSDNVAIESVGVLENKAAISASSTSVDVSEKRLAATSSSVFTGQVSSAGEGRWLISSLPENFDDRWSLPVVFRLKEKNKDQEDLVFRLLQRSEDGDERIFWEKTIAFDVMKSDLNLSLSLNENKGDQAVNFGETLNYSLTYSNNGDSSLYDLVLMAVIKGEFIQWSTLRDPSGGSVSSGAIIWSKEQIPALAEVAPGSGGQIDFSIKVKDFSESDLARDMMITSYAQYGLNDKQIKEGEDNKSNTIKSLLNSDLSLSEKILYFNEDNVPIGSGPLPPRVNQTTRVRVLWTIKNNLHDLENVKVSFNLPPGVVWAGGETVNVGSVSFDQENRQVIWQLGFLPLSVYRADAEFNISLTPNEPDRDKILVLSSGGLITAVDTVTRAELKHRTSPKTTKLEDDEIAGLSNSGKVE